MITPDEVESALTIWRVHLSRARRTHTPEAHEALLKAEDRAYEAYQRIDTAFKAQEAAKINASLASMAPVEFEGHIVNRG